MHAQMSSSSSKLRLSQMMWPLLLHALCLLLAMMPKPSARERHNNPPIPLDILIYV